MRKLLLIIAVVVMIYTHAYSQVITGKFIRFGVDSIQVKTETDILNLPISKDLVVLDQGGQRISPSSLFENANVTIRYEEGLVKSIVVDNQLVNYIPANNSKPEYQLIYKDPSYQYKNYQQPVKVSYVGYLPADYQIINYPLVDVYNGKINYYSYSPVNNTYTFSEFQTMSSEIKFYNDLLANNYYSPRYYYENLASVTASEIPNYYYISKMQEKSPYYYKKVPTSEVYYANNQVNQLTQINTNPANNNRNINGIIVEVNSNSIKVASDRIYEVQIGNFSNILIKNGTKYTFLDNNNSLNLLLNKPVQLEIVNNGDKMIATTVIINAQ